MTQPDVEVAFTRNAGWCWRCHPCDVNVFNLREQAEARGQAARHEASSRHLARLAEGDNKAFQDPSVSVEETPQ